MYNPEDKKINFAFFGTDDFSLSVLKKLVEKNLIPSLVISAPDKPSGRGNKIIFSAIKKWSLENGVEILQPEKLGPDFINDLKNKFSQFDFFVVASYGKIIPKQVLDLPKKGSLNVHPSLLPKYRGSSPIETAILNDELRTGVTIMLMDEAMDHGPIIRQGEIKFDEWPSKIEVEQKLAEMGGSLLCEIVNSNKDEKFVGQEQNHAEATFTKKINKDDGLIDFKDILEAGENSKKSRNLFLKIIALNPWPSVFFKIHHREKEVRVKITAAKWENGLLKIERVIPEGKKQMDWQSFKTGYLLGQKN